MATLTFHGAAREVTGSCYLLQSPALGTVLLDCGMHQGGDAVERIQRETFTFDPRSIDAVILSHSHLDHTGLLPKLVNRGFSGPVHCTAATADLLEVLLNDSAGLYFRDIERDNLRQRRRGKPLIKPEYSQADVETALKLCRPAAYGDSIAMKPAARLRFLDAGHILGSSIVELTLREKGRPKTLVFSGDLGNGDSALMNDPATVRHADLLLMEGTYGNRNHRSMAETVGQFADALAATWKKRGNVMIPSFAVARTQEILFHLGQLYHTGRLDDWLVFLDSPMAIEVTQLYDRWLRELDPKDIQLLDRKKVDSLASFLPILRLSRTPDESMAINRIKSGAIIIAGSGMCTGGRIHHHLKNNVWRPECHIVIVGYQAIGTLGRRLVDGADEIRLWGDTYPVRARVHTIGGLSAHGDQADLLEWYAGFENSPPVYLVHGEPKAQTALRDRLKAQYRAPVHIATHGQSVDL